MTYEPIERAQKYLKDINEQLEQLKRGIDNLTAAAQREESAKDSYLITLEDELNEDPQYSQEEINAVLYDTDEAIQRRIYNDYYADIEAYKESVERLKADREIYKYFIEHKKED